MSNFYELKFAIFGNNDIAEPMRHYEDTLQPHGLDTDMVWKE